MQNVKVALGAIKTIFSEEEVLMYLKEMEVYLVLHNF